MKMEKTIHKEIEMKIEKTMPKKAAGGAVPPGNYARGGSVSSGSTASVMRGQPGAKHSGSGGGTIASVMRGKAGAKR